MPGNVWIIVAVVAVVILRRFSRLAGSALGMLVAVAIGVWGGVTFDQGAGIALLGFPLSRPVFIGLVGVWFAIEGYGLVQALRRRSRAKPTE